MKLIFPRLLSLLLLSGLWLSWGYSDDRIEPKIEDGEPPTFHYNAGLGPATVFGVSDSGMQIWLSASYGWSIAKTPVYVAVNLTGKTTWGFVSFDAGTIYRFSENKRSAPFMSADAGLGLTSNNSGVSVGAELGWPFYLGEEFQLQLGVRGGLLLNSGPSGLPGMFGVKIEAMFQ